MREFPAWGQSVAATQISLDTSHIGAIRNPLSTSKPCRTDEPSTQLSRLKPRSTWGTREPFVRHDSFVITLSRMHTYARISAIKTPRCVPSATRMAKEHTANNFACHGSLSSHCYCPQTADGCWQGAQQRRGEGAPLAFGHLIRQS
eukprot:scaffold31183_cov31-Tisochrysis_lutea.AAC.6